MKINAPLSEEDHARADEEHRRIAQNQIELLHEVASLIESGEPLTDLQRKWAAGAIRGFASGIPVERTRPPGKTPKVPEEALVLWQAYIASGNTGTQAEGRLAALYDVDLETLQSRLKRLKREIAPATFGFTKWGKPKKGAN